MPDYVTQHPGGRVQVYDILNAESFVRSSIAKAKLRVSDFHELQDVVSEGMAIMLDLASKFNPHMPGYDKPGSFAGYCSKYLPNKIRAAWHNMHPEHLLVRSPDGKKRYEYGDSPKSLSELIDHANNGGSSSHDSYERGMRHLGEFVSTRTSATRASQPISA